MQKQTHLTDRPLRFLKAWEIERIDQALAQSGPFAEVRLIKNKGKLRFIQVPESENLTPPRPDAHAFPSAQPLALDTPDWPPACPGGSPGVRLAPGADQAR